ncbi:hypothetical protein C8F04DRAFT_1117307 [Mycena alexandri]|uniref:Uncharacterized protein n=1 Tax=Mycena alexandri TaxID=1745969 RepID=A0AAD6WYA8_9AGAR|nr:hypothetical protein C8F04DRAFT_1117307 [Mycena alexandri]
MASPLPLRTLPCGKEFSSFDVEAAGLINEPENPTSESDGHSMRYINWLGVLSIPIVNSYSRIITVLGGTPRDVEGWHVITDYVATFMEIKATRLKQSCSGTLPLRPVWPFLRRRSGGTWVFLHVANEFHCSFIQYTAGGLFCFIRNRFKTDHAFEPTAMKEEKRERAREA